MKNFIGSRKKFIHHFLKKKIVRVFVRSHKDS